MCGKKTNQIYKLCQRYHRCDKCQRQVAVFFFNWKQSINNLARLNYYWTAPNVFTYYTNTIINCNGRLRFFSNECHGLFSHARGTFSERCSECTTVNIVFVRSIILCCTHLYGGDGTYLIVHVWNAHRVVFYNDQVYYFVFCITCCSRGVYVYSAHCVYWNVKNN